MVLLRWLGRPLYLQCSCSMLWYLQPCINIPHLQSALLFPIPLCMRYYADTAQMQTSVNKQLALKQFWRAFCSLASWFGKAFEKGGLFPFVQLSKFGRPYHETHQKALLASVKGLLREKSLLSHYTMWHIPNCLYRLSNKVTFCCTSAAADLVLSCTAAAVARVFSET